MAKFYRNKIGIGYLKINFFELMVYSENSAPICDECLTSLLGNTNIILLPILNEAYCDCCGRKVLERIKDYPEDREYRKTNEEFWKRYFRIKEESYENK